MRLVSVVIPAYKAEASIGGAIRSAMEQEPLGRGIEIIVVVDGSPDASAEAARAAGSSLGDGFLLIEQENAGPAAARNAGIRAAKGDFIAFLDADDSWLPGKLPAQVAVLDSRVEAVLVACTRNGYPHRFERDAVEIGIKDLLRANYIVTSGVLARKEALLAAGLFDARRRLSEDYELWLRMACLGKIIILDKPYVRYAPGGTSSRLWKMERAELETLTIIRREGLIGFVPGLLSRLLSFVKFLRRVAVRAITSMQKR